MSAGGTRRQRRAHRTAGWVPRTAVLAVLGALTVAAPLTGFAAETAGSAQAHPSVAAVRAQTSILSALGPAGSTNEVTGAGSSLLAKPGASARAGVQAASRADERLALDAAAVEGASGIRAAVVDQESPIVMPLAQGTYRLTSAYGYRIDPIRGGRSLHTGTDMAAPLSTPIHAIADGVVDYVGPGKAGRSSMLIILKHEIDGKEIYSWYNHMYADGLYVQAGQEVAAGEVIAGVGNNGYSTGPHLHLEIHTDDRLTTTDPLAWLAQRGALDVSQLP